MNIIILVGFIIKFLLVLLQFFVELPLTQTDPAAFHNEAISFKEFLENRSTLNSINYEYKGGFIYSTFLGLVYFIFGESKIGKNFASTSAAFWSPLVQVAEHPWPIAKVWLFL